MDWDDASSRARLIESVGIPEYNRRIEEHLKRSVLETYKDRDIRPVGTRFGRLFAVGGTKTAFSTIEKAREFIDGGCKES